MAAVGNPGSESDDPYSKLGLTPSSGFEAVQQARERCLREAADDPQAQARVEAAYDAVLMARLRNRQDGQVSQAAASASAREQASGQSVVPQSKPGVGVLQKIRSNLPDAGQSLSGLAPQLSLAEGQGLIVRIAAGVIGLALLLVSPGSTTLVLALAVIGSFLSSVRRGRRALPALGWTLLTLIVGLLLGALLMSLLQSSSGAVPLLSVDQIQAIPALVLLWLAALLLA